MISAEQIADIDQTIAFAVHTYPGCRFVCVDLEAVSVEDAYGDFHIFDTYTRSEMTSICGKCDEYRPDSDLRVLPEFAEPICRGCEEAKAGGNE